MSKFIQCIFRLGFFVMVLAYKHDSTTQGDGMYSLVDIGECDTKVENVILAIKVQKYKVNHTQEVFRLEVDAAMDVDDSFESFMPVCKHVDGGCKHFTNVIDNFKKILNKHAKKNIEKAFTLAGIDPPEFPIPKGHHVVEDFIMDYCELPTFSSYGRFEAEAFLVKNNERVGCLKAVVDFAQPEEDVCNTRHY